MHDESKQDDSVPGVETYDVTAEIAAQKIARAGSSGRVLQEFATTVIESGEEMGR